MGYPVRILCIVPLLVATLLSGCTTQAPPPAAPSPTAVQQQAPAKKEVSSPAASEQKPTPPPAKPTPAPAKPTPSPTKEPLVKLQSGYAGLDAAPLPLWVAKEAGLFEKNGLDVDLLFVESGTRIAQAILGGEIPIGNTGGSSTVAATVAGGDMVIVMGLANAFPYKVMVAPTIKSPEQLKGKKLGISRFGSSSDVALRFALKSMKLDPDKDVSIIQIGGDSQRTAALQSGAIDGTVLNPPGTTIVRRAGFNELLDMAKLDNAPYQHGTISTTRSYIAKSPDVVRKYVRSVVEAIQYQRTHKEEAKRILAKYTKLDDAEGLEEAFVQHNGPGAKSLMPVPYPTKEGLALVIEEVAAQTPAAKSFTPDKFVDERFVKELEDSGFIKKLYGQ
ncbi:MAG: ABC transporter substrate-binding protein [Chloroflexi bacterium]|nr:ABC transporter substrate-binding protein [Chloroflexota bacterium]